MKRILIQCGDNLENRLRVLSLAERLKAWGAEPVVAVYTRPYASLFQAFGIEALPLFASRNPSSRLDRHHPFDFSLQKLDLFPLEREKARLAGESFDAGRAFAATRRALVAVDRVVKREAIDELIVWNGHTGAVANAMRCYKLARQMGGGFIERGLIKDATIFDRHGVNGASSMALGQNPLPRKEREGLLAKHMEALQYYFPSLNEKVFRESTQDARRRRILVPLQVQRDSNIILYSEKIKSMRRLVLEAIRLRRNLGQDWDVVVRPHPEEVPDELPNIPVDPHVKIDSETSLNAQLAESLAVLTVNSTVGLEAAFAGCVPIVFGEGVYCREPFVLRAQDGSVCGEKIQTWGEDRPAHFEKVAVYLARLLDNHQLQPVDGRRSEAEGLRNDMHLSGDDADFALPTAQSVTLSQEARSRLGKENRPLIVHAIDLASSRVNETYRDINVPISRQSIERAIRLQLGEWSIELSPVREPAAGDVAVIGPKISPTACSKYSVIMDHTGAVRN